MPQSAYDFSIRESLQRNRKVGLTVAAIMILLAGGIAAYYLWPHTRSFDPTRAFYSDDDGQTYFVDSVYDFPPFDHDGKTAVEAVLAESGGHYFVAYLARYKPAARKQLQEKYDDAVRRDLPVQQVVIDFMGEAQFGLSGMEVKLPGSGNKWEPRSQLARLDIRSPDGKVPDRYLDTP
jgi:hypothetical protein